KPATSEPLARNLGQGFAGSGFLGPRGLLTRLAYPRRNVGRRCANGGYRSQFPAALEIRWRYVHRYRRDAFDLCMDRHRVRVGAEAEGDSANGAAWNVRRSRAR